MTIQVRELKDHSFEITWDENDPIEKILNDFTEEDFIQAIKDHLETVEKNA